MALVVLAQSKLGLVKLTREQQAELKKIIESSQPFVQEVAEVLETGNGSKEAVEFAEKLVEIAQQNPEA